MSKVIKAIILAVMVSGIPSMGMSTENTDINLGSLESIRAKTALTKAQVAYLQETQKLNELRDGKSKKSSFQSMDMAPMEMPPGSMQMPGSFVNRSSEQVLNVMGVNGKFTATIKTDAGIYKVRKGERVAGGVLTVISLDQVVLEKNGRSVSLPFAE